MKYIYKSIIVGILLITSFLFQSLLYLMISYLVILFFISKLYENIYIHSKKWANIILIIIMLVYFLLGLYNKALYETIINIPAEIIVISQVIVFTIYPYSLNVKAKRQSLYDNSEINIIRRNNFIIRVIISTLIITILIFCFFM